MHKIRRVRNSSGASLSNLIYTNLYDKIYKDGLDWSNNQFLEFKDKLSSEVFDNLYKFTFCKKSIYTCSFFVCLFTKKTIHSIDEKI